MPDETGNRRPATGNLQPFYGAAAISPSDCSSLAWPLCDLPLSPASRHVSLQLVRTVTGAGANYEEARAAESRADFVHKLGIAAKEIRKACYWMSLIMRSGWVSADLEPIVREATELAAILGTSHRTVRTNAD